jgi:hypothetical protein
VPIDVLAEVDAEVLADVDADVESLVDVADVDAVLVEDIESDADADPLDSPLVPVSAVSPSSGAGHAVDVRIKVRQAIRCMGTTMSACGHHHRQIDDRRPRGP